MSMWQHYNIGLNLEQICNCERHKLDLQIDKRPLFNSVCQAYLTAIPQEYIKDLRDILLYGPIK